jgi:hypothetical protein
MTVVTRQTSQVSFNDALKAYYLKPYKAPRTTLTIVTNLFAVFLVGCRHPMQPIPMSTHPKTAATLRGTGRPAQLLASMPIDHAEAPPALVRQHAR